MRLLVVAFIGKDRNHVLEKHCQQVIALAEHADFVKGLFFTESADYDFSHDVLFDKINLNDYPDVLKRQMKFDVLEYYIDNYKPDAVYMRYPLSDKRLYEFLLKYPDLVIFEHNTKEKEELLLQNNQSAYKNESDWFTKCMALAKGMVAVTKEIQTYELARYGEFKNSLAVGNGIALKDYSPREKKITTMINILFYSVFVTWQGFDRFIEGLNDFTGDKSSILVHVVGYGPELQTYKKLIENYALQDNFIFYGQQSISEIKDVVEMADIAVSSLAVDRRGMLETAALKNRMYCYLGIPFIYAGQDIDFADDLAFAKRFPLGESPIKIEDVLDFCNSVKKNKKLVSVMEEYARKYLSFSYKMLKIYDFIKDISSSRSLTDKTDITIDSRSLLCFVFSRLDINSLSLCSLYNLASFFKRFKVYDLGLELFIDILRKTNNEKYTSGAFFHMGEIYFLQNKYKESKKYFTKCLAIVKDHSKANQYLLQIG